MNGKYTKSKNAKFLGCAERIKLFPGFVFTLS